MRDRCTNDLADCAEFNQSLHASPPRLAHAAVALATAVLVAGVVWAALTPVSLVVEASGRVRPAAATQAVKARFAGRVVAVHFAEGLAVRKGQVLARLDTDRLDIEIRKRRQVIAAGEDELARSQGLLAALARQAVAERETIREKLAQAQAGLERAQRLQEVDVRQAELGLRQAQRDLVRAQAMASRLAAAPADLEKARAQTDEAEAQLARARLPVDGGMVLVLGKELLQVEETYALRRQEQEQKRRARQDEVEAARRDLDQLLWEHEQASIRAPLDGVVTTGALREGVLLEAGGPVAELAPQGALICEIQVPSDDRGLLKLGLPARVKLDAYDHHRYGTAAGTVVFIAPDSAVAKGRSTYLVRVALHGDAVGRGRHRGRIKLGMAGRCEVITGRESLLRLLVRASRQRFSLG